MVVPPPACTSAPLPPMAAVIATASLRAMRSVPSFVTAPLPSVPALPPLPICSVPALMAVVPV